jgi:WD40 repeat protein
MSGRRKAEASPPQDSAHPGAGCEGAPALEEALSKITSAAVGLDAVARARLAAALLEASGVHLPAQPALRPRSKAKDSKGCEGEKLVPSPGKIPRRRVTPRGALQGLPASSCEQDAPAVTRHRPAARSALLQTDTLFFVFRFLDASHLVCASSVCSIWRAAASDERLWMWLYLESGLEKPAVMSGSWRKDFMRKQQRTTNWLRGCYSTAVCSGHREAITCLSASGTVIVTGSDDMDLRVWDLREDACEGSGARCVPRHVYSGHTGKVLCCCMVRGLLVSGSEDKTVRVWDLVSGTLLSTLYEHTHAVLCMTTDEKRTVFTGGADNTVCMWSVDRMESRLLSAMKKHKQAVLCMTYCHAINSVISGGRDHDVAVWRAGQTQPGSEGSGSQGIALNSRFWADDDEGRSREVNLGDLRMLVGHEASVTCVETEGHIIATGSDDKSVRLWNAVSGACLRVLEPHGGPVSCITIRGQMLLSGSFDGKVRLFDLLSARCLRVMSGHKNAVLCLAATQRVCATGANDREVRIWDFHDDSPPPIPADVAAFKENWGMPAARPPPSPAQDLMLSSFGRRTSPQPVLPSDRRPSHADFGRSSHAAQGMDGSEDKELQSDEGGMSSGCGSGSAAVVGARSRSLQGVFKSGEGGAGLGGTASEARNFVFEPAATGLNGSGGLASESSDVCIDILPSSDDETSVYGRAGFFGNAGRFLSRYMSCLLELMFFSRCFSIAVFLSRCMSRGC